MTEQIRNNLYEKILYELNGLTESVIANYQKNMLNRENNPFLVFDDANAKKYMALGRSIDSQIGNRIQRIIFYIARLRYGECNVPNIVEINIKDPKEGNIECVLYSVSCDLPIEEQNKDFNPYKQYIEINKHSDEKKIKKDLKIKARSTALMKQVYEFSGVSQKVIKFLKENDNKKILVDLLFFESIVDVLDYANVFEIKMGGNLDTKNAKSNADEVEMLSSVFGFLDNHYAYFATCYGECSSAVKSRISGEGVVCNSNVFWNKIIPLDMFTYEDFISIYAEAFRATDLEVLLNNL